MGCSWRRLSIVGSVSVLVLGSGIAPLALAQQRPQSQASPAASQAVRNIVNVKGDLYRVRSNAHYTVFLRTPEGIILSDPINRETATWLQGELQSRFGQPVRYVLQSHHHYDHASGAAVFKDAAEIIGHENFAAGIRESNEKLNAFYLPADRNSDHRLSPDELTGRFAGLRSLDRNGDGTVTPAEMYADVIPPERTIKERHTVTLGGKRVEMIPLVPQHAADMVVLRFPAERAVFVVDFAPPKTFPANVTGAPLAQWVEAAKQIEALDFDIFVPGHGEALGTKADVTEYRGMLEELLAGVSQAIERGQSVEQLQASDLLSKYNHWTNYETGRGNVIATAYENLKAHGGH